MYKFFLIRNVINEIPTLWVQIYNPETNMLETVEEIENYTDKDVEENFLSIGYFCMKHKITNCEVHMKLD